MGRLKAFEEEARDLNRRLWFLWVATAVALLSLALSQGVATLVWLGVLGLCVGALLYARRSYVRLGRQVDELPPRARPRARDLLMRHGRFLLVRLDVDPGAVRR